MSNIFDGYIQLGVEKFKTDPRKGMQLVILALENIQKHYGNDALFEAVKTYELEKLGIQIQNPK